MEEDPHFRDAIKLALRRAGLHWLRAGYEVVAGWASLLDEVAKARRGEDQAEPEQGSGPTRIELE